MNKKKMHHLKPKAYQQGVTKYNVDFLETLVYEWVRRSIYIRNFHLSNSILKSIANRFKAILNLKSFSPSKEWLQKFRITYNLKNVHTSNFSDISYKCSKSTLPADIFNELQPQWASLDPVLIFDSGAGKVNETIYIQDEVSDVAKLTNPNCTQFLDIEDELPVCTIFGRKTVENVANIISSSKKSNEDTFEPMIVCTDPKNLNAIGSAKEHSFFNSKNTPDVDKIKDLINGKLLDSDSNNSSQNEYIDQYLKEIVRVPEKDKVVYPSSLIQSSLKTTSETEKCETSIFKPISLSSLKIKKAKPKQQTKFKQPSNPLLEVVDTKSLDSKKPNRKRKIKQILDELPTTTNATLETKSKVDQAPITSNSTLSLPVESLKSLQKETINQMPAVVQQAWNPSSLLNTTTSNFTGEITSEAQSSLVGPGRMTYTFQMPETNQNQLTMPYIAPMTTNLQMTGFGQQTTLPPIFLHLPMALQTTEVLPGSEMPGALMNLTQTASLPQTSFIPSIDLTQQSTPTQFFTNCIQNQLISPIKVDVQQSLSTQTSTIVTTPTMSTTSAHLGVKTSNCILTTIPTEHVPNCIPTTIKPTKTKSLQAPATTKPRKIISHSSISTPTPAACIPNKTMLTPTRLIQPPASVSTKTSTITSSTSNSALTTPTSCLPVFVPNAIKSTTATRIQLPLSTQTPTITTSTSNLTLTTPPCLPNFVPTKIKPVSIKPQSTTYSIPLPPSVSIKKMPTSTANSSLHTKPSTPTQVTITKKSRSTPTAVNNTSDKKGTRFAQRAPLETQEEVIKCIKLMEDFAMMNDNFRLIGFLERLEQQININKKK